MPNFLNQLGLWPLLGPPENHELLSRFVFKGEYRADGTVRPRCFVPRFNSKEISVFRTQDLDEHVVWRIGRIFVERKRKKNMKGRAEINVGRILKALSGLTIRRTWLPHPRHANIRGFPMLIKKLKETDPLKYATIKQQQKTISKQLARLSKFIKY